MAREELGEGLNQPTFLESEDALIDALKRFEQRKFQTSEDVLAKTPKDAALDALPLSTRQYLLALVFHELSLDQQKREIAEYTTRQEQTIRNEEGMGEAS